MTTNLDLIPEIRIIVEDQSFYTEDTNTKIEKIFVTRIFKLGNSMETSYSLNNEQLLQSWMDEANSYNELRNTIINSNNSTP